MTRLATSCVFSAYSLMMASATFAQTTADPVTRTVQSADSNDIGSIVVTARRREESNIDVPIAISAFSEDMLTEKGVTQVDDLQRIAPSISFRPNAGRRSNSIYEIRGAAGNDSLITGDPAVGVYVDEVYRARAIGTNQSFFDIANVQVLYGPQGTLFGRNSASGAVLINTRRPTDRFEGELTGGIGNLNRYELTGVLNVPVTEKLAIRVAGQRVSRDGYGTNVTTGRRLANINSWAGRASISYKPTDNIENISIMSYYRANERGSLAVLWGYRPCPSPTARVPAASCSTRSMPDVPNVDTRTIGQALAQAWQRAQTLGRWETALNATTRLFPDESADSFGILSPDPVERSRNFSATNITSIDLNDSLTLKNILGYNYVHAVAGTDLDATPISLIDTYLRTTNRMLSEELQLQGTTERLTWVVGGMYFRESGTDVQPSIQNVYSDARQRVDGVNKSYAVFAQGTYKITDELSLTAGGRYTWDKRRAEYIDPFTYTFALDTLVPISKTCSLAAAQDPDGDCTASDKASFKQPTYTLSVDYKPTPDLLFYAAHRLGYRSGGVQARTGVLATGPAVNGVLPVTSVPPFGPEKVRDLELGFKGDFRFGGESRMSIALAAFRAWYSGLQRSLNITSGLSATTNPPGAVSITGIVNAGNAHVDGFSAEGALTLVRGFSINGSLGYVDGVYKRFRTTDSFRTNVPFTNSKWTASLGLSMTPIDDDAIGTVTVSPTYSFRSRFTSANALPDLAPEAFSPAQHLLNLSINWDSIFNSRTSAQLWMRNLTNERYPLGFTSLADNFGLVTAVIAEPRTYGLNISYKF